MTVCLVERLQAAATGDAVAVAWHDNEYSYTRLVRRIADVRCRLDGAGVPANAVATLEGDFSPNALAVLFALIDRGSIAIPLRATLPDRELLAHRAQAEVRIFLAGAGGIDIVPTSQRANHSHYVSLREPGHPGLVLFSSGSNGRPKAIVHDFTRLLTRYARPGRSSRICAFLAFDHIGGMNTALYTLLNGGCLVVARDHSPDEVCRAIACHGAEVLPATPTFLNLLLHSGALDRFDVSSLTLITYGTEVMPESTLRRLRNRLPGVRLLQTYGLSETGILATRSPESDSLWLKVAARNVETRVVGGVLHVRTPSTMLGYLDSEPEVLAPDGWFDTGDLVETRGDLIRVIGRANDVVNVSGLKVHPSEVESVVLEMGGVVETCVSGETNALTGQSLRLDVVLTTGESAGEFRARMRRHCGGRLEPFKIPQRVVLAPELLPSSRHKKLKPGSGRFFTDSEPPGRICEP